MANQELLRALKLDKEGKWEAAHLIAQSEDSPEACWLHAYLHRKEGDDSNAAYWYSRAGKSVPSNTLDEEWDRLHTAFS